MTEKLLKTFEALRGHYNQVYAVSQLAGGSSDGSPSAQRQVMTQFISLHLNLIISNCAAQQNVIPGVKL